MLISVVVRNAIEKKKIKENFDKCIKREVEKIFNRIRN
jgi:hypothetical protein